jgi:hypothetical protein
MSHEFIFNTVLVEGFQIRPLLCFLNIFAKKIAKIWRFLFKICTAVFLHKFDHNIVFWEKRHFSQKIGKFVITTSTPGSVSSSTPWSRIFYGDATKFTAQPWKFASSDGNLIETSASPASSAEPTVFLRHYDFDSKKRSFVFRSLVIADLRNHLVSPT